MVEQLLATFGTLLTLIRLAKQAAFAPKRTLGIFEKMAGIDLLPPVEAALLQWMELNARLPTLVIQQ
jgi:hypothetical protein